MYNFLDLKQLTNNEIQKLIIEALEYKHRNREFPNLNADVASIFLESSTRTKSSFELAAVKTGNYVLNIEEKSSAITKGESFQDTLDTLGALGVKAAIVRSSVDYYYKNVDTSNIKIINAGDGAHAHPSQSLLDLTTIYEHFGKLSGLKILIMGDIKHSRVAHSNIAIMERLGLDVSVYAPSIFKTDEEFKYVDDLEKEIKNVDIVMLLRNQLERHSAEIENIQDIYLEEYGLSDSRLDLLLDNSIIMHPGPFNRNVELSDKVLSDNRCKIYEQVTNGLYCRMAILNYVLNGGL